MLGEMALSLKDGFLSLVLSNCPGMTKVEIQPVLLFLDNVLEA